ncbi:MAG: protein kinase [Spirulina sp.]
MDTLCLNPQCAQPVNPTAALRCQSCGADLWLSQRYRCVAVLGQGGFGRTYRAVDESVHPPQICVVKQLWPESMHPRQNRTPEAQHQRFRQEAEQLAILGHHPQIPRLLEALDTDQGQFLVQEYIPGPNLDQLNPPLEETQIRRLLSDLLPVLQFIHDHQVIHRDIKPANIIAPPDNRPFVLVDFGASKTVNPEALAQTGTVIGSAGYAAPEQTLGKAVFASDIFSLGLTCLHLLTGLHPFDLYAVGEDAWIWQPFLTQPISPALARVLDRMVNRRLKERYSRAQEVMADLRWGNFSLDGSPSEVRGRTIESSKFKVQSSKFKTTVTPWQERHRIDLSGVVVQDLAIHSQGRTLAAACADGSVRLWDCTNGQPLHQFRKTLRGLGHRGTVTSVIFGPGETVISGGEDGQVIQWDLADPSHRQRIPLNSWQVSALAVDDALGGDTLAVACGDGRIYLVSLTQQVQPKILVHHQAAVTALAVNLPEKLLVSGSQDRTIRLWSLPAGRLSHTITAPKSAITALACHPQDGRIISGDAQGQVQVWDASQPAQGSLIQRFPNPITALAISPNGQWLAMGTESGTLALVNLTLQRDALSAVPLVGHGWSLTALAFTPDSRMMVSASADETLRFWCPTS